MTPLAHTFDLKCERCGYDLSNARSDDVCPECGTPVRTSLGEDRIGVPWQHRRSVRTLVATMFMAAFRPRRFWKRAKLHSGILDRPHLEIMLMSALAATAAALIPPGAVRLSYALDGLFHAGDDLVRDAIVYPVVSFVIAFVGVVIANVIVATIVNLVGRGRHASIRWTVTAYALSAWFAVFTIAAALVTMLVGVGVVLRFTEPGPMIIRFGALYALVLVLSIPLGLAWHLGLALYGLHALRHRNQPGATTRDRLTPDAPQNGTINPT